MAKGFKNFRDSYDQDEWGDKREFDKQHRNKEKRIEKRRKNQRKKFSERWNDEFPPKKHKK